MTSVEEDLKKSKQGFKAWIRGMAHDTASPLAALANFSESIVTLLEVLNQHPELVQQYPDLKSALNGARYFKKRVPTLITELQHMMEMNVQKAYADEIHASPRPLKLGESIQDFLNRYPFREDGEGKSERNLIHLNLTHDFSFQGDAELFYHLLANLTKNALYALKAAGKGEIFIESIDEKGEDSFNTLLFKDTGTGITPDSLPHLFEPFYTKTRHGAGLGLFLCRKIMEAFQGSIQCESVLGEHTQFTLRFPKQAE